MIEYALLVHGLFIMPKRRYPLLSRWLQNHQIEYNWTYKALAELVGVHTNVIYLYKNGKCFPIAAKIGPLSKGLAKMEGNSDESRWMHIAIEILTIAEIDQRKDAT